MTVATSNERSYFDGGLLQYIGWSILGGLITTFYIRYLCTLGDLHDIWLED